MPPLVSDRKVQAHVVRRPRSMSVVLRNSPALNARRLCGVKKRRRTPPLNVADRSQQESAVAGGNIDHATKKQTLAEPGDAAQYDAEPAARSGRGRVVGAPCQLSYRAFLSRMQSAGPGRRTALGALHHEKS